MNFPLELTTDGNGIFPGRFGTAVATTHSENKAAMATELARRWNAHEGLVAALETITMENDVSTKSRTDLLVELEAYKIIARKALEGQAQ